MQLLQILMGMLLFASISTAAWAKNYEQEIENFFSLYAKGEIVQAVDSIYSTNKWVNVVSDQILNVKGQLTSVQPMLGAYLGQDRVGHHSYGERLIHITYLALFERQPLRMEFTFYRPGSDWFIYSFAFDDRADDDLQRAARMAIATGD